MQNMHWNWLMIASSAFQRPFFTTDETQAGQMAARLECGGVFINGYCASDARVAFGGVKKSGFGRELSHFGLHEFCNIQTVWKDRI
ncbi:aldehyde-dehydrogenase like protein YneI [Escherichia coli TA143]|nr:aldehyde-dehydrogenase like protein YneI [Escherichia coli TA143]